ncbi:unnamed protein product [Symbiodinium microadriaticum]|nr:unnamed protein product [Symbiodinium microadriaticum]
MMREQQRKEEAAQAAFEVDATEEEAVQKLLGNLSADNGTDANLTGVLGQLSQDAATGRLKVVAFLPEALERNYTVTAFSDSSEEPVSRVEVSPEVLAAAGASGPVLLTVTSLSKQVTSKFQDQRVEGEATSLVRSEPVSINLRAPDGTALTVKDLKTPLRIVIKTDIENSSCAFWDEEESRWSYRGVTTLPDAVPGQITCLTVHLSVFSAVGRVIWENALLALSCSSWDLLSPEALEGLSKTHWQGSLPAISTFTFLVLFGLVFARASYVDRKSRIKVPWEELEPVLFKQATKEEDSLEEALSSCCWRRLAEAKDWTFWSAGICFGLQDIASLILECKAPEVAVNRCIRSLHAHRSGVATDSLDIILPPGEKFELEEPAVARTVTRTAARRSRFSRLAHAVVDNMDDFTVALRDLSARWNVHIHGAGAVQSILRSCWLVRVGMLFPAFHPWIALLRHSLLTTYKVRVALIFLKLCTAGATNALFFTSSSPGPGSDPNCRPARDLLARLVQNTVVGMLSAFLGDCVIFALFLVQDRKPTEKHWTPKAKARQLRVWRCRAWTFWVVWTLYSVLCLLYIMAFLANMRLRDAHQWHMSTGMSLLQDLLVRPLFIAFGLGTAASLGLLSRGVRSRTEAKWLQGGPGPSQVSEPEPEEAPGSRRNSDLSAGTFEAHPVPYMADLNKHAADQAWQHGVCRQRRQRPARPHKLPSRPHSSRQQLLRKLRPRRRAPEEPVGCCCRRPVVARQRRRLLHHLLPRPRFEVRDRNEGTVPDILADGPELAGKSISRFPAGDWIARSDHFQVSNSLRELHRAVQDIYDFLADLPRDLATPPKELAMVARVVAAFQVEDPRQFSAEFQRNLWALCLLPPSEFQVLLPCSSFSRVDIIEQPAELSSTKPGDQGVLAPSKGEAEVSPKADPTPADKAEVQGDEQAATRAKLRQLKAEADGGPKQQELANAAKILRKLSEDTSNVKLYSMRRDVLERAVGVDLLFVFEAAGFEERESETGAVLQWRGPEATTSLQGSLQEVQKAADLALDPESMTFQQVSEMVAQGLEAQKALGKDRQRGVSRCSCHVPASS